MNSKRSQGETEALKFLHPHLSAVNTTVAVTEEREPGERQDGLGCLS
jgi:hypothetical protein